MGQVSVLVAAVSALAVLGAAGVACGGGAKGSDESAAGGTEEVNRATIRAAFDAWAAGTGGPFELLEPDATWTIVGNSPVSRTYTGRQDFLDVVIDPFNARMAEPLVPSVRKLYADGDTVIALFDAAATAKDDKPYRNTYTWYMQMRDGRIVDVVAFFDTIEFTDLWNRVAP